MADRVMKFLTVFFTILIYSALGLAGLTIGGKLYFRVAHGAEAVSVSAPALPVCSGPNRSARKVTCVVDGDTFWIDGVKYRLACVDAAELGEKGGVGARDVARFALGFAEKRIIKSGISDKYGRRLVRVEVSSAARANVDLGRYLVSVGLARVGGYSNTKEFCEDAQ